MKNWKKYLGYEYEEWCETNHHIQEGQRHDEHPKFFLPIHNYD